MSEALTIRTDTADTGTTAVPSGETAGFGIPLGWVIAKRFHLKVIKGAASGTRTARVKVFGYTSKLSDYTAATAGATPLSAPVGSSGAWEELFDTEELSEDADFKRSYLLEGLSDFSRLDTQILTNGGTTPTLTSAIGISGDAV